MTTSRQPRARSSRGAAPSATGTHDQHLAVAAQVGADAVAGVERLVGARERLRPAGAQGERLADQRELGGVSAAPSAAAARVEVDRAAVVRVHQREVLELVAAVDVRDAGGGELEQQLAERGAAAGLATRSTAGRSRARKPSSSSRPRAQRLDAPLVVLVLVDPGGLELGLAQRLLEEAVEAVQRLDRVGAEQGLQDEEAAPGSGARRAPSGGRRRPSPRAATAP